MIDVEQVPAPLRHRLGTDGSVALLDCLDDAGRRWKGDVIDLAIDRFERRLVQETSGLRVELAQLEKRVGREMADGLADVRREIAEGLADVRREIADGLADVRREISTGRVELIRWSFVFWIGQVLAMLAMFGAFMHRP